MSNPTITEISTLSAYAVGLYARVTRTSTLHDIAPSVRGLSAILKHLKIEADDPDSVLNSPRGPVYLRQLTPALEDCDFTLRQLGTVLDKDERGTLGGSERDDVVSFMKRNLEEQRIKVGLFLDTVQLQSSAGRQDEGMAVATAGDAEGGRKLDEIKDKVDAIANKIFARRDSGLGDDKDEDLLWEKFRDELVREGFAPEVLRKHKDVLRAYIRELESADTLENGQPASVRGLLEQGRPILRITPASHHVPTGSPQEYSAIDDGRYMPYQEHHHHHGEQPYGAGSLAVTKPASDGGNESSDSETSRTLISTNDLLTTDLPTQFNGMYVSPAIMQAMQSYSASPPPPFSSSPDVGYLPSAPTNAAALAPTPQSPLSASPRFVPPLPSYTDATQGHGTVPTSGANRGSRLNPDQNGNEIPAHATWTRIRRTLVSPVVLDRAGVRYEARPDFVAVLGELSREQVREFARQSDELRRARARARPAPRERERAPYPVSEGESWSESDSTESESPPPRPPRSRGGVGREDGGEERGPEENDKGTRSYPFIVNPPSEQEEATSPSSTVKPKPILKNKNENRVHFGPDPYETPADGRGERDRERERSGDRDRDRDRERDRDRDRERDPERRRRRRRRRDDGERERDHHDRDRDRDHDRDRDRDREREREHRRRPGDKDKKRSGGRDALYAAGLGGAAASLMSVLAEAAASL